MALTRAQAIERERDRVWFALVDIARESIGDRIATADQFVKAGIARSYAETFARASRDIASDTDALQYAREALELLDHEQHHERRAAPSDDPRALAANVPPY